MSFPVSPADGDLYNTPDGRQYKYSSTTKSWDYKGIQELAYKNNLSANVGPSATDDSSKGYSIGSHWVKITSNTSFICVNASVGSAVWKKTSGMRYTSTAPSTPSYGDLWYDYSTTLTKMWDGAAWIDYGFRLSYAYASLPLLTSIPTASAPIIWTPTTKDITYASGTFTINVAGLYEIEYVANYETTAIKKSYFVSLVVGGVADNVQGLNFSYKNTANNRRAANITMKKIRQFTIGTTFTINHFTDKVGSTVSGDLLIKRIG